ncbi:MAG: hypothetical protein LBP64_09145 [Tannerella sp.]|jgi:hypothetical protein|nr:hypothetical protein [Tannerella sp.]
MFRAAATGFVSAVLMCTAAFPSNAQDRALQHEFQFNLGANSHQAYELELAYSLMYRKTVGITVGLNTMQQTLKEVGYRIEDPLTYRWVITKKQRKAGDMLLRPALRFRFPILRQEGENVLYFNIEPGAFISLNPNKTLRFDYVDMHNPAHLPIKREKATNAGGRTLFYHIRGYLTFDIGRYMVSAGFGYSDFDIYNGWRNIVFEDVRVNDLIWKRRTTRTLFISAGYYF